MKTGSEISWKTADKMKDLDSYIEQKRQLIESALSLSLPSSAPELILASMRYCLETGGKRLRPILVLAAAEALGAKEEEILDVACAMEYMHTYSLIHDDLPAMDDSSLRRGLPACHTVYGDALAILTGDAFLTLSFEMVARFGLKEGRAEKAARIALLLARATGASGMVGGQVYDLLAEGKSLSEEQIKTIAALKTGALIQASVECGAICAGANSGEQASLARFGALIGKAFQIIDDLLDYEQDSTLTGKPVGADQERGKATFPALLGKEEARRQAEELYLEALNALGELKGPAELLAALAHKLVYRIK